MNPLASCLHALKGAFLAGDMEKMALHAFQPDGVMEAIRREGSSEMAVISRCLFPCLLCDESYPVCGFCKRKPGVKV